MLGIKLQPPLWQASNLSITPWRLGLLQRHFKILESQVLVTKMMAVGIKPKTSFL